MKTALIQQKYYNSKNETIKQTVLKIEEASKNDVELIVLQELHQTHYFCQNENVDVFDIANSWDDDILFWSSIAKKNKIVLAIILALILPAFGEVVTIYLGVWTYYWPYQLLGVPLYAFICLVFVHMLVYTLLHFICKKYKINDLVFN